MRTLAGLLALALFALPLFAAPVQPVMAIGVVALVLGGIGIAVGWPGPVTAAACAFLAEYAAALAISGGPVSPAGPAGFSVALFLLLHVADFARRVGSARVAFSVVRAHARGWVGVCAGASAAGLATLVIAGSAAAAVPLSVSPLLAGLGALGAFAALAAVLRGATRVPPRGSPGRRGG